tara:strand:+ start:291 stop:578 length:288 start_codon:yes stop_codon:yes gene_type:complete
MEISKKTIEKIAHLARLKINEADLEPMQERLSSILTWVEQLSEVPTDNIEPMFSVHLDHMPCRSDKVTDGGCADDVLSNAPESALEMYSVPKVVE